MDPVKEFYEICNSYTPLVYSPCDVLANCVASCGTAANLLADLIAIPYCWSYAGSDL